MAKQVVWDDAASDDLRGVYTYLLDLSEKYADSFLDLVFARVELLEQFPRMGRIVPEMNLPSIRELIVENYRVLYFVNENTEIRIIAVRHSAKPLS